jgi:FtsP/CotA-like multicopper oxidase with cupredoxin domain
MNGLSRRAFVQRGMFTAAAVAGGALIQRRDPAEAAGDAPHDEHMRQSTVGEVGPDAIGIDPMAFLTTFDYGKVSRLPDGRTLREWDILAFDREIEVAPGVFFMAWTYNGQVPGPTLRCTEGDLLRVNFRNGGTHPHTIHFHGFHPPRMDGFTPEVAPGETFTYEFTARPFGLHPYHCHAMPLKKHLHKGLYGALVIDPPGGRAPAREMVMVMNGFDTNFDGENEIYAVNSIAFHYQKHPIRVRRGEPIRVYLLNLTEFDPINSFHLHASMFNLFRTGTRMDHYEFTDIVMLCQGERAVLEFTLDDPGLYMFHAHQSELAELGWMGFFESVDAGAESEGGELGVGETGEARAGGIPGASSAGVALAAADFGPTAPGNLLCDLGGGL